ncbi:MAG: organic hydroperoxide resistance protein [Aerococcus sp.]|nr:organic hydroperoxide resistance protein [Aerococcus sp.]
MSEYQQIYETTAINTSGRDGESHLSDGSFKVDIAVPKEMGGSGNGVNPEQLFALGYSACFNSALGVVKRQEKISDDARVRVTTHLYKTDGAPDFKIGVDITVGIANQTPETAQRLAEKTHLVCPYSKAVAGNIDVNITGIDYASLAD